MADLISQIRQYNAGRDPVRLARKYQRMRASAFVFLRGSCHLFYRGVPAQADAQVGPLAWQCGDLHLENFGSFKAEGKRLCFDINDFEEAALAPVTWDILRLLASILVAAPDLALDAAQAQALADEALAVYASSLAGGQPAQVDQGSATGLVAELLAKVADRKRVAFVDKRTTGEGPARRIKIDEEKTHEISPAVRQQVAQWLGAHAHLLGEGEDEPGFFEVLDVAGRVAGTGSLGLARFMVLVRGKGGDDGQHLLDLKQALPSALAPHLAEPPGPWPSQGQRVVTLQRRMQAASPALLQPIQGAGLDMVLRALQASDDSIKLEAAAATPADLAGVVRTMAQLAAWAALRGAGQHGAASAAELSAFAAGRSWRAHLMRQAQASAAQVQLDWAVFAQAFDQGAVPGA